MEVAVKALISFLKRNQIPTLSPPQKQSHNTSASTFSFFSLLIPLNGRAFLDTSCNS